MSITFSVFLVDVGKEIVYTNMYHISCARYGACGTNEGVARVKFGLSLSMMKDDC